MVPAAPQQPDRNNVSGNFNLVTHTGLPEKTITKLLTVFSHYPEINEVILYGSRAKGNYKPGSDIDIALKGNGLTLSVLTKIETEIDDLLLPYTVDCVVFEKINNTELTDHINRVGIQLFPGK